VVEICCSKILDDWVDISIVGWGVRASYTVTGEGALLSGCKNAEIAPKSTL
jgi:hypothetical protein